MIRSYCVEPAQDFVRHLHRAHLRLQIVGRDLGRRNDLAILARHRFLDPAVKEISDVRIFLRLGDAQLLLARRAHHIAENVLERLRPENDRAIVGRVILGQGDVMHARPDFPVEAVEILEKKSLRELPGAIGPEVEEDDGIAVVDALFVRLGKDQRRHELVRLALCVMPADRGRRRVRADFAAPEHDRVPGELRPVPAPVAIHREIATDDGHDPRPAFRQLRGAGRQIIRAARSAKCHVRR